MDGSLPVVMAGHCLSATALAVGLDMLTPVDWGWYVWGGVMVWAIARTVHIKIAQRRIVTVRDARLHAGIFTLLTMGIAITWGAWGYMSMSPDYPVALALVMMIISGIVSGGVGSLSPFFPAFIVYGTLITAPPIMRLFMYGEEVYMLVAVLALALFAMNMYASYSHNQKIRETIHLRYRIGELVDGLKARATDAERANAAKTRFLSAASHDLRQPLQAISLYADLLENEIGDAIDTHTLVRIREAAAITTESMDQLLDLSQLEAGVLVPHVAAVELAPILNRIETMFMPAAKAGGIQLRVRPCRATVMTDPRLLERMLQNLVANAIRYTPAGGRVFVGSRRNGDGLCAEIRDNGPGIGPEHRDAIFEEFRQLVPERAGSGAARPARKGLGLGLSIVKRMSGLLGHDLEFVSEPGCGSTFRVHLAIDRREAGRAEMPADECLSGIRCLLVDDDAVFCDSIRSALQARGARVWTVSDVGRAESAIASLSFDVIVSELRVGKETCVRLLEEADAVSNGECICVMVTADQSGEVARTPAGRWTLLYKPVNPLVLVRLIVHRRMRRDSRGLRRGFNPGHAISREL